MSALLCSEKWKDFPFDGVGFGVVGQFLAVLIGFVGVVLYVKLRGTKALHDMRGSMSQARTLLNGASRFKVVQHNGLPRN